MNFILKIVEGPNKGAEIALPDGVSVTLGKSDSCDIVLADRTMPDSPLNVSASEGGVTVDGEALQNFHVRKSGMTSFAVGPADATWGELVWPEDETASREAAKPQVGEKESAHGDAEAKGEGKETPGDSAPAGEEKKRHGCLGCLFWMLLSLVALAAVLWFFRDKARPYVERSRPYCEKAYNIAKGGTLRLFGNSAEAADSGETLSLPEVVASRGLEEVRRDGKTVLVGNFATRAERLAAAAEAYAAQPGVELDFADAESLETAVADTLALVGETGLKVVAITNRVAVLSGGIKNIRRALDAISADVPKIANVDVTCVSLGASNAEVAEDGTAALDVMRADGASAPHVPRFASKKASAAPTLPVCGILMTPYPCLVLRDGKRILEGAPVGGSVVVKIEADSVTLTNATGKVVWKP